MVHARLGFRRTTSVSLAGVQHTMSSSNLSSLLGFRQDEGAQLSVPDKTERQTTPSELAVAFSLWDAFSWCSLPFCCAFSFWPLLELYNFSGFALSGWEPDHNPPKQHFFWAQLPECLLKCVLAFLCGQYCQLVVKGDLRGHGWGPWVLAWNQPVCLLTLSWTPQPWKLLTNDVP